MIRGAGQSSAEIMVVSDYPSKDELAHAEACFGTTGYYIDQQFQEHKYSLNRTYRTIYCKKGITAPKTASEKLKVLNYISRQHEGVDFGAMLVDEINLIGPNVILSVGEAPLNYLTGNFGIDKYRGSVLPIKQTIKDSLSKPNIRVVPIIHPRDIYKNYSKLFYSTLDVGKAVQNRKLYGPIEEDYLIWIVTKYKEAQAYFDRIRECEYCAVDIETFHNHITCIGFCADGKEAVCIPLWEMPEVEAAYTWRLIAQQLKKLPVIGQNYQFDDLNLRRWGFKTKTIVDDTMVAFGTLYPEFPKNLGFITSITTDMPYHKDEGKEYDPKKSGKNLYIYCAKDCIATWRGYKAIKEDLVESNLWDFHRAGPMKFYFMYQKSNERGIRIDEETRFALRSSYETMLENYASQVKIFSGIDLNYNSPNQVCELLYNDLKLPIQYAIDPETGVKRPTVDEEAIEYLILNCVTDTDLEAFLYNLLTCRKLRKIIKTLNMRCHPDGRLYTSHGVNMTETGRTNTRMTFDKIYEMQKNKLKISQLGYALQTIPKHGFSLPNGTVIGDDITKIFCPSKGYIFVGWDQKQAEDRFVSVLAEEWERLESYDNVDQHSLVASWIYGHPINKKDFPNERQIGKRSKHLFNYGGKAPRIASYAKVSVSFAGTILDRLKEKEPNIQNVFHYNIDQIIRKTRTLVNPFGRRRVFFGRIDDNTFREGYSQLPQSGISDHTKFALLRIHERMPEVELLLESHDGVLEEVPKGMEERYHAVSRAEVQCTPIDFRHNCSLYRDYQLYIPIEREQSESSWYDMKEI